MNDALLERAIRDRREALDEAAALRGCLREAILQLHQTGLIRDHHDPADKTGWNVHGIETCADPLCVEALALLKETT
jgi:hypothetical protein